MNKIPKEIGIKLPSPPTMLNNSPTQDLSTSRQTPKNLDSFKTAKQIKSKPSKSFSQSYRHLEDVDPKKAYQRPPITDMTSFHQNLFTQDRFEVKKNKETLKRVLTGTEKERFDNTMVQINGLRYIEFLIYHIFYFGVIGPLIVIPFALIPGMGYPLGVNLMFYARTGFTFWMQISAWIVNVLALLGFYFFGWGDFLTQPIIISIFISVFMRSTNIAGKYSTFNSAQIEKIKSRVQVAKDVEKNFMMFYWAPQKLKVIYESIKTSIIMERVEESNSRISFMKPMTARVKKKFVKVCQDCYDIDTFGDISKSYMDTKKGKNGVNKPNANLKKSSTQIDTIMSPVNLPKVKEEIEEGEIRNSLPSENREAHGIKRKNEKHSILVKPKKAVANKFKMNLKKLTYIGNKDSAGEVPSKISEIKLNTDPENPDSLKYFKIKHVMVHLIQEVNRRTSPFRLVPIAMLIGFFRGFIPPNLHIDISTEEFSMKLVFFPGHTFAQNVIYFMISFNTFMFYAMSGVFCNQAIMDLTRRNKIMQQLTQMVRAEKDIGIHKVLPTLNLVDSTSVYSWLKLRKIVNSYGTRFFRRHEMYLAVLLVMMISTLALFLFAQFNLFFELPDNQSLQLKAISITDFFIASVFAITMITTFATLNSFYDVHVHEFIKIRAILQEIYLFKEHFLELEDLESDTHNSSLNREVFDRNLSNPIFHGYILALKRVCQSKDIVKYLKRLIKTYDKVIDSLKHEQQYDQLTVLGVTINKELLTKVVVGAGSGAGAGMRLLFN